ncbi:N-acetylglucosamine-6-phosphate deacetylase [Macrococcus sp. DPC7161]|uniref:N-acetylglucosamine-6-phosphate deacetylase n=1 Tax=Macrococcus sp. DPC7161 TaxID=2507060 RepID=UPI00100B4DAE|nr:N-acetylglucosamine-6-phosphate deacetylase [Macrococcus sp. DPC7161]RXK17319.1 N-acetylglucosamine-6-phosphate deacetylase [Macrococcus sp. DPC7161]
MKVFTNGKIYTEQGVIDNGYIIVKDGTIESIHHGSYQGDLETIDCKGQHVLPGFIDIHIHGGYSFDTMDATKEAISGLAKNLVSEGTTSFLPTTMTDDIERVKKALANIADYQNNEFAEVLGIHLEGPFISEHKVGAQNPKYVIRPTVELVHELQKVSNNQIKIVTIAPEVEGALEVIEQCDDIIFSAGHTIVDFDGMNNAVTKGLKHITHLYNAATPFTHRAPGAFGAALLNDDLKTECIVDGVHSHPGSVAIAYRMKGNTKFMVITDAMRAKGLGDGASELGGQAVYVKGQEARLEDGTLAGSVLKMNEGLKLLKQFTNETIETLWRVMSLNQAESLGVDDRLGSIKEQKQADFVIIDDEINVLTTVKKGYTVYNR